MNSSFIKDILLIQDKSIVLLHRELLSFCGYFVAPFFTVALVLEYLGAMDFGDVVKRLLIAVLVMSSFFYFHKTASDASLDFASDTLKKVSPRNLFMKKWSEKKVRTKLPSGWDYVWLGNSQDNINDLFGTALFLMSKILFIVLKLIYSTVYHLNYVFSGYTALCFFFKWTQGALRGTFLSLGWCVLQPFVLVAILCIVGNSFDQSSLKGEVVGSGVDHMVWLFGVSLLIVATPIITYTLISGGGVQGAGAKLSELVVGAGLKSAALMKASSLSRFPSGIKILGMKDKLNANNPENRNKWWNRGLSNRRNSPEAHSDYKSSGSEKIDGHNVLKTEAHSTRPSSESNILKHSSVDIAASSGFESNKKNLNSEKKSAPVLKQGGKSVKEKSPDHYVSKPQSRGNVATNNGYPSTPNLQNQKMRSQIQPKAHQIGKDRTMNGQQLRNKTNDRLQRL